MQISIRQYQRYFPTFGIIKGIICYLQFEIIFEIQAGHIYFSSIN